VRADVVDRLVNQAGEVAIARSRIEGEMRALKAAMQELTDNVVRLRAQLREIEIQAESQMQSRLELAKETQREFDPLEFDRFTRFQEVTRLMAESVSDVSTVHGNLVNTVDETEAALLAQARLNRDLQQDLMRVRMVPFGSLAERLYRIVRQTSKEAGKRANLDIKGVQVELDRSVLERITGPFEHLLRNAVTHGIEAPDKRRAAGKPEIGDIRLELKQEGNEVQLSLSDDGGGLDIDRIRAKAIEKGLIGPRVTLSEAEIADFIFNAGFSTATEVTQIAGRGVGMDVVRSEVAALGGRVEMRFTRGQGTRFTIYLPLTLAVTQAVLVRAGNKTYAIPAVMVEQVLQLRQEQLVAAYASRQTEWQDRRYPFHYLPHLLGAPELVAEQKRFSPTLYLRSGTNAIALHVDEMVGSNQEIVVKAIGPQLQRIAGITGATVLGSGEIVLILNPVLLALKEVAGATSIVHEAPKPQAAATQPTIMVVDDSLTVRKVTGRLLERQGYLVVTARDGVEAMEKLQELVPDVMLVDVEMPRMDGFDLTRNVRGDARLSKVPIIMITSRTAEKHQSYAREIGVSHFLGKPYQEDDLLDKIGGFLKDRRAAA
jgi:chemosensory pili system protein ChpA (sensor histidine kinase/response regulator)